MEHYAVGVLLNIILNFIRKDVLLPHQQILKKTTPGRIEYVNS
jgi:hypothetical protein